MPHNKLSVSATLAEFFLHDQLSHARESTLKIHVHQDCQISMQQRLLRASPRGVNTSQGWVTSEAGGLLWGVGYCGVRWVTSWEGLATHTSP